MVKDPDDSNGHDHACLLTKEEIFGFARQPVITESTIRFQPTKNYSHHIVRQDKFGEVEIRHLGFQYPQADAGQRKFFHQDGWYLGQQFIRVGRLGQHQEQVSQPLLQPFILLSPCHELCAMLALCRQLRPQCRELALQQRHCLPAVRVGYGKFGQDFRIALEKIRITTKKGGDFPLVHQVWLTTRIRGR